MKKLKYFFLAWFILGSIYYLFIKNNLGDDYYYAESDIKNKWILKNNWTIVPRTVIEYSVDNKYIIAVRIVTNEYNCGNEKEGVYNYGESTDRLEYWLVDKKKKIVYYSLFKDKITQKLQSSNSRLIFKIKKYDKEIQKLISFYKKDINCIKIDVLKDTRSKDLKYIKIE